jgi:hypothetical protein
MALTDQELHDAAAKPQHVAVDGMSVTMPAPTEAIAADKYAASKGAMKSRHFPLRYARFAPPGAVGPRSE